VCVCVCVWYFKHLGTDSVSPQRFKRDTRWRNEVNKDYSVKHTFLFGRVVSIIILEDSTVGILYSKYTYSFLYNFIIFILWQKRRVKTFHFIAIKTRESLNFFLPFYFKRTRNYSTKIVILRHCGVCTDDGDIVVETRIYLK